MKIVDLPFEGLKRIDLVVHGDARGFFVERYRVDVFAAHELPTAFAQENHSRSAPGVLRGLHYQVDPPQSKLIGVARGRIWDVVVDLRARSATYGQSYGVEINDVNGVLLWVPAGFAHGFCVLGDEPADVLSKVDGLYNPATEGGIRWDDPELAVEWPVADPTVSARDRSLGSFAEYRANPCW
jgi:dTDP-4-dehydrorhamnose 3,5-epimerase